MPERERDTQSILVVEDDEDIREGIADALRDQGYAVTTATNGAEALDQLKRAASEPPSLILLDLMMPVMNGWELCQAMQDDGALASIPVVVLSGDAHAQQKTAALRVQDAIAKPISLAKLLEVAERYCAP
jgi:CheY-like chemotaxis protein